MSKIRAWTGAVMADEEGSERAGDTQRFYWLDAWAGGMVLAKANCEKGALNENKLGLLHEQFSATHRAAAH
jgi:hypothetical protein